MRASQGVVYSRKRGTWHLKWFEAGKPRRRQLGTIREVASRAVAEKAAEPFRRMLAKPVKVVPIVSVLVEQFKVEKMSTRTSTSHSIKDWLKNHIIPAWGEKPITDLQAR